MDIDTFGLQLAPKRILRDIYAIGKVKTLTEESAILADASIVTMLYTVY